MCTRSSCPSLHSTLRASLFLTASLGAGCAFARPIVDNFSARPDFLLPAVPGDFTSDKEFQITDRSWTAVRVVTGPVATPGNVFHLNEVQIYVAGIQDSIDGTTWDLTMRVRENGFSSRADPEVDTPNAASGAGLPQLITAAPDFGSRESNPAYSVVGSGGTLLNNQTFVFTPTSPIELQPDTVYWFSATSAELGDRIRWKAATANGKKSLGFESSGGWSLGCQTLDYTVGEAEFWNEPLPPGTFDLPLLIAVYAIEEASSPLPETAPASLALGLIGLAWAATPRLRRASALDYDLAQTEPSIKAHP